MEINQRRIVLTRILLWNRGLSSHGASSARSGGGPLKTQTSSKNEVRSDIGMRDPFSEFSRYCRGSELHALNRADFAHADQRKANT